MILVIPPHLHMLHGYIQYIVVVRGNRGMFKLPLLGMQVDVH